MNQNSFSSLEFLEWIVILLKGVLQVFPHQSNDEQKREQMYHSCFEIIQQKKLNIFVLNGYKSLYIKKTD